ncbi:collagen-like domain-containing protein [Aminobacter niigataensis]|uniref:hypothetical protein n=1 Tax=Aminobacter niigataensis TaxID=83265 RepID=UPI00298EE4F6|nr:hypothetical protein [Aminobacter niigataensis]
MTGTVSVSGGNAVVTGTGTAWSVALVTGGMFSFAGMSVPIASVESDTSLTLAYPWPGATSAGAYAIARETSEAVRAAWINDRLAQILTKLSLAGIHPDGAGTLAERDALSPAPVAGFLWLRVETGFDLAFYKRTGGGWDGPFSAVGDEGPQGSIGPAGEGFNPVGAWAIGAIYAGGDFVSHSGRTFVSLVDGNVGNTPPVTDADDAFWMFIPTAVGPAGPKGDTGDTGLKGDTGDVGATGPANSLAIGTVTGGAAAEATITGSAPSQTLNLVLPKGDTGDQGIQGIQGPPGAGSVDSVNGDPGPNIVLDLDDIGDGATNKAFTSTDKAKLGHISVTQAVDLDAIEARVVALDAAVVLSGTWDASSGAFPGGGVAQAGQSWIVSVAGTVDAITFNVNDRIIAIADNASTGAFAANWFKADYTDQFLSLDGATGAVTLGAVIAAATVKATPVDADTFALSSSTDGNGTRRTTWANIKSTLKAYFDGLYALATRTLTTGTGLTGGGDLSADRTLAVDKATAANIRAGTADKVVTSDGVAGAMAWVAITAGASPAIAHDAGVNRTITHSANATMGAPSATKPGFPLNIDITPGAFTTSWHANYKFGSAGAPSITARRIVHFMCRDASTFVYLGMSEPA